jgi:hypothetical protein
MPAVSTGGNDASPLFIGIELVRLSSPAVSPCGAFIEKKLEKIP